MTDNEPKTPEEAVFAIYSRMTSLETTIRGTPNTAEKGLVGEVQDVKALAVEVKDYYFEQSKDVSRLKARCAAFHGESGNPNPGGNYENGNPLSKVPKKKVVGFLAALATFVSLVIYNLGQWVGWWTPPTSSP